MIAIDCSLTGLHDRDTASPTDDLQAILDRGDDLLLQKGQVYLIKQSLSYKHEGQKIATKGASSISEYATLRIDNPEIGQLINGNQLPGIILEEVILDGNRYELSILDRSIRPQPPLILFGGNHSKNQVIRKCVMLSARTWSTLKIHEGGTGILAENNIVLGAGTGARGNGRSNTEPAGAWGDGISCAARNSIIRNNLIIDPTDVGIVLYGAPGSLVEENVIAAVSRESLGAINLVDPLDYYVLNDDHTLFDFSGVVIRNNWMDSFGGRFHIALPMGAMPWAPKHKGKILTGARVHGNHLSGGAAAYGFILEGVENFNVYDNKSTAEYSGIGEGYRNRPPDDPGPFLYNPENVSNSVVQGEFKPMKRHLDHLLRCNHGPRNAMGYRFYPYGDAEVLAIIQAAYHEMLGRDPDSHEVKHWVTWFTDTKGNSDHLRRTLMRSDEFIERFGQIDPLYLHTFRNRLWLAIIDQVMVQLKTKKGEDWPAAKELYAAARETLDRAHDIPGMKETMTGISGL